MVYYVFPFDKIQKDSRIIIYAAGEIGNHYYNQLEVTDYCKIVLWVDKKPDNVKTKHPAVITKINNDDYDYIIIALYYNDAAEEAKDYLLSLGIPKNKIIYSVNDYFIYSPQYIYNKDYEAYCKSEYTINKNIYSSLTLNDYLSDNETAEKELIKYFYESGGDVNYFAPFINEVNQILLSEETDKSNKTLFLVEERTLDIIRKSSLSAEAKIVLLRVIFQVKCFSKELMRELVILTGKIKDNLPLMYWLLFDISYIWFLYPDITYEGFFKDRKELMRNYAQKLNLCWNPPEYNLKNNRDICILVINLDNAVLDPVTKVISPIVCALNKRGYNLHVINIAPQHYDSGMGIMKPFIKADVLNTLNRTELLQFYPDDIKLYSMNNATMKERQQDILDLISRINPYCILDFSDEFAPISFYYSQNYPTIYFPIRKQGFSSSFFHKYIFMSNDSDVYVHEPIKKTQVLKLPFFKEYVKPKGVFDRRYYGFDEEDVVIITVGTRLQYDISNSFAEKMCILLRSNKNLKWICVGCNSINYIEQKHKILIGKSIEFIECEADLPGLYKICDIYMNPLRVGGGTTIAWAMQQGLAIASPVEAAAGTFHIGRKNSVSTEDELINHIEQLYNNRELLNEKKLLFKSIADNWDLDNFINCLIDGMDILIYNFELYININKEG